MTLATGNGLVRVEETRGFVLLDQLAEWCTAPGRQIDVHPVIDLADHIATDAYEVPNRLAAQTRLRHLSCVFPHCTRPARRCDCDHITAHQKGGTTCSCNIAPLCRGHHRLKTHGRWRYTELDETSFLWSSPYGYHFLRDHTGTRDVTGRRGAPPADLDQQRDRTGYGPLP